MKITLKEMATEVRRELHMRGTVYPKLVNRGQLEKKEARRRFLRLKATLEFLEKCDAENKGEQSTLL